MKKYIAIIFILVLPLTIAACGNRTESEENSSAMQRVETHQTDLNPETEPEQEQESVGMEETEEDEMKTDQIYIEVGENTLTAVLEDNESAKALKELLDKQKIG